MRRADPAELEGLLERFDYSRVGTEWAVVRLLARLGGELGAPGDARLEVTKPGQAIEPFLYPARACSLERRLIGRTRRRAASSELLWRAAFALPLEIVECQHAVFELTGDGFALALPAPGIRLVTARALALTTSRRGRQTQPAWHEIGAARRRLVAVATAVAVTAGSTPAAALADASAGGSTGGGGTGTTSGTTAGGPADTGASGTSDTGTTTGTTGTGAGATGTGTGITGTDPGTTGDGTTGGGTTGTGTTTGSTGSTTGSGTTGTDTTGTGTAGGGPIGTGTTTGTNTTGTGAPGTSGGSSGGSTTSGDTPHRSQRGAHARGRRRHRHGSSTATCTPAPVASPVAVIASGQRVRPAKTAGGATTTGAGATKPATTTAAGAATPTATCVTTSTGGHRHGGQASDGSAPEKTGASAPGYGNTLGSWTEATHPAAEGRAAHRRASSGGAPLSTLTKRPPTGLPKDTSGAGVSTLSPTPSGFLAPRAWTGTVLADPALTGAVTNLSGLLSNGDRPPSFLIPIYMEAGRRYGVPWEVLAAINAIESDYGRDLNTSSAGAIGWMQFEPSTWREYGSAKDGHSVPNPYDPRDAIFAAARYLAAAGARHDIARAVFAYNHANWYVQEVLSRAAAIASHAQYERQTVKHGVFSVYFATGVRKHQTIRYHSGVLSHFDRLIAAANMVSAANFPYLYGGGHEQPARFAPFDCSGSVSYVMQQAGYKVPTTVSGDIPIWKFPSGPGRVTIFYNPTHTFMRIGNRFFGTSGFARPGGGAGWFDVDRLPAGYLAQFSEVHVPRLGLNSFAPPAPRHNGRVHRR